MKYVASLRRTRTDDIVDERPYIGLEHIESATGRLLLNNEASADTNEPLGVGVTSVFEPGDVLFGKLRPYLAKAWVAQFPGRCSTELIVMRPHEVNAHFLFNFCLSNDFLEEVNASTFGSKMPRADWDIIGSVSLQVPGEREQQQIVRFLERTVAEIDALTTAKQRVLAALAEKRSAVIVRAVMRGIDATVPMQDSGIEWLGSIPRHWDIERGKWLFEERDDRSTTGDEVLLSLRMERGLVPHNDVSDNPVKSDALVGYKKVSPDEIVLNRMRAASGLVAVSPQDGLVSPDYAVFCGRNDADPHYYGYLFRTGVLQSVFRSESTGLGTGSSGFLRLYSENFLSLSLPSPPHDEQRRIVEYIRKATGELDELSSATLRSIELLKERRAALITSVVTGETRVD